MICRRRIIYVCRASHDAFSLLSSVSVAIALISSCLQFAFLYPPLPVHKQLLSLYIFSVFSCCYMRPPEKYCRQRPKLQLLSSRMEAALSKNLLSGVRSISMQILT
jgi:hypothetical protein